MAYSSENSRKLYAERDNNRQGNIGRQGVNRDGQSSNVGGLGERNLHRMLIDERKNINLPECIDKLNALEKEEKELLESIKNNLKEMGL